MLCILCIFMMRCDTPGPGTAWRRPRSLKKADLWQERDPETMQKALLFEVEYPEDGDGDWSHSIIKCITLKNILKYYYIILYYIILHYIILYYIILYYIILHYITCFILKYCILYDMMLYVWVTRSNAGGLGPSTPTASLHVGVRTEGGAPGGATLSMRSH